MPALLTTARWEEGFESGGFRAGSQRRGRMGDKHRSYIWSKLQMAGDTWDYIGDRHTGLIHGGMLGI